MVVEIGDPILILDNRNSIFCFEEDALDAKKNSILPVLQLNS
jgi:hypothetical protein